MLLGVWWDLLSGRSEEYDASLEVKLRTNKSDVIVECEEVTFEGRLLYFEAEEGVTKFLLLVVEGLDEVSVEEPEWKVSKDLNYVLIWWRASFILGVG